MAEQKPRHPGFIDLTGQTFGFLTVVREVEPATGKARGTVQWLCRCPNGTEVVRTGIKLRSSKNSRCSQGQCACTGALAFPARRAPIETPAPPEPVSLPAPRTLDPERNRERYVRLKLHLRSVGLEPKPFAELTCSKCPEAPACPHAFDSYNTDGDCLEAK
jgi:hypothetical protein